MTGAAAATRPAGAGLEKSLQSPWLIGLLCLAAAWPLVLCSHMPLTDIGGHLGRFAVQVDAGRSADLRQWYGFRWNLIPNLGTDLLMQVLAPLLGLEPALKAIVVGIVALQAAGFLLLARAAHGRVPPTALFALPLVYSYPFQFGFINFALSVALATCALALWLRLGDVGHTRHRWLLFAPIACALWLCHLAGWALFCIFAGSAELMRHKPAGRMWTLATLGQCALALSCLLAPWLIKLALPSGPSGHGASGGLFNWTAKLGYLLQVLRDRWMVWDIGSALMLIVAVIWFHRSRWFARHDGLALGAVLAFALYLVMPHVALGSFFADMRLAPVVLAMALLAARPAKDCPAWVIAALTVASLAFVGLRFAGNATSYSLLDRAFARELAVLDAVPRGSQLVTLVFEPCDRLYDWPAERRSHLAGYAIARRHAYGNDQWTIPGGQLLQVRNPALGPFEKDPSQHVSDRQCGDYPSLTTAVGTMPAAVPLIWVTGYARTRALPGWREFRRSGQSAIYARGPV